MSDNNDPAGRRPTARAFVEKALQAERSGDDNQANEFMKQALQIDPDETVEVLQEENEQRVTETEPEDAACIREAGRERSGR